ncbi:amidohydrolase [Microbulbifer bruguierae]|uniref:Amidohydrolase n=1 Tax=Microbulbifer bruguierae TaxID=3029061 RepID=A0ABY8NAG6_9GAMM|nr:amidohydrolase [Microbulbifer bruguierae]WGL15891.1 amidohydrolase [Microbulbifer bruguierae]
MGTNHMRSHRFPALYFFASTIFAVLVSGCAQRADHVLLGGEIYTMDSTQPRATALAVTDGKFSYVGDEAGVYAQIGPETEVIALEENLVLPGLIDTHTHPGILALFASTDLVAAPDPEPEALLQWLESYAEEHQEIPFIIAGYWRTADFGIEGPDRAMLDQVVSDRPVALMDDSGHSMWLNSKALALMGVSADTPDPAPGLAYYQRGANNEPTGWIKEFTFASIQERIFETADPAVFESNLENFLNYLSSKGVTSLYDGGNLGLHDKVYGVLAQLDREGRLPLRYEGTYHVHLPEQIDSAIAEIKRLRATYAGPHLQFNAVKIHFDGVHEIRTSAVLDDFEDDPGNQGGTLIEQTRLIQFIGELHREKLDLHMHVVGDRATRLALDAYEAAKQNGWDYPQLTLCHLELVDDADIPRFKELGVIANFTPHWFGDLYQGAESSLGERNTHKMRARSFIESGAKVTFSSDVVVPDELERANPFLGMQIGINRQDLAGGANAKVMQPIAERLTLTQLIEGYTINGARQLRKAAELGSITVGKNADLVILKDNIFSRDRYQIHSARISQTMLGGKFVFDDQQVTQHD